jgi:hypothetical protein
MIDVLILKIYLVPLSTTCSDGPFLDFIRDYMCIPYVYRIPTWAGTLSFALDAIKDEGHFAMPH